MADPVQGSAATSTRLSTAVMDALTWDCSHTGEPVNGECAACARTRDAILGTAGTWLAKQTLRALVREAVDLRMTLYYGIPYDKQPELSDAANRLGGVLAKMEQVLNATD